MVHQQKHQIITRVEGENIELKIKKESNIFIYRIIVELIQNVLKHAKAKTIKFSLSQKGSSYYFVIEDDGIGASNDKLNNKNKIGGFGLLSIRERLEGLNGHFQFDSFPGKTAQPPLHPQQGSCGACHPRGRHSRQSAAQAPHYLPSSAAAVSSV